MILASNLIFRGRGDLKEDLKEFLMYKFINCQQGK